MQMYERDMQGNIILIITIKKEMKIFKEKLKAGKLNK